MDLLSRHYRGLIAADFTPEFEFDRNLAHKALKTYGDGKAIEEQITVASQSMVKKLKEARGKFIDVRLMAGKDCLLFKGCESVLRNLTAREKSKRKFLMDLEIILNFKGRGVNFLKKDSENPPLFEMYREVIMVPTEGIASHEISLLCQCHGVFKLH